VCRIFFLVLALFLVISLRFNCAVCFQWWLVPVGLH